VIRVVGITLLLLMVFDHVVYDARYIEATRMMRSQSLLYSNDYPDEAPPPSEETCGLAASDVAALPSERLTVDLAGRQPRQCIDTLEAHRHHVTGQVF